MSRRALGLLLALFACSDDSIGRLGPTIRVTPSAVDFGLVPIHATRIITVSIQNEGSAALEVSAEPLRVPFGIEGSLADSEILNVPPGQTAPLELSFAPATLEAHSSVLVLHSNARGSERLAISLFGEGVEGTLDLRPPEVDFTGTLVRTQRDVNLLVTNSGLAEGQGRFVLEGFTWPDQFRIHDAGIDVRVAPGRAILSALSFLPQDAGSDQGRVWFETCGVRCGLLSRVRASASSGALQLEPHGIDFGPVAIGSSKSAFIDAVNAGNDPVEIHGVRVVHGSDLTFSTPSVPSTLPPGARFRISLEFSPLEGRTLDAVVAVRAIEAGEEIELRGVVEGTGEGSLLLASPSAMDFGTVTRPGLHRRSLLLINAGSRTVRVHELSVSGSGEFAIENASQPVPFELGKGESTVVDVVMSPTTPGEMNGTVVVGSTDDQHPTFSIPVHGVYVDVPCELTAPGIVDFGAVNFGAVVAKPVVVRNTGTSDCVIRAAEFGAGNATHFVSTATVPLTIPVNGSYTFSMELHAPNVVVDAKASYFLHVDSEPPSAAIVAVRAFVGTRCHGTAEPCACGQDETIQFRRFDQSLVGSLLQIPPDPAEGPLHAYCVPQACGLGQASVELTKDEFACYPFQRDRGFCTGTERLEIAGDALTCVPCDVLVQAGAIFFGSRSCTHHPDLSCVGQDVPTFVFETSEWECRPICDNGLYDQRMLEDLLVCIPC